MPQSLAQLYVHLIFSTKNREPSLTPDICSELWPYMATVLQSNDCHARSIGGTVDHVHVLCSLSKTTSVAELVEGIKTPTSKWLKTKGYALRQFHWQNGYAAFSVSHSGLDRVHRYITNQNEHHRVQSFQDEVRDFLKKHAVEFDERYLWD